MEVLFAVLCFVNGYALGVGTLLLRRKEKARQEPVFSEGAAAGSMAAQVENFLNYDGTSRGQRYFDER